MASKLVPKPNVTAAIWAHFCFKPDDSGQPANLDEPICCICLKKSVSWGNASNLRSHLRINHPAAFAGLAGATSSTQALWGAGPSGQMRQMGVAETFARREKYHRDSNKWRALTDSVTRYLVEEMVPFNTVKKPAFKATLQDFDKQYILPNRKYFFTNCCT